MHCFYICIAFFTCFADNHVTSMKRKGEKIMKKRIAFSLAMICALVLLNAIGANSAHAQSVQNTYVSNPNPADRLHLRATASTGASSLGKYYNGVRVDVLAYSSDTWAKVRIGNTEGYMLRQYLTTGNVKSVMPVLSVKNPNASDGLNLREKPMDTAKSLGKYYNGTTVYVMGIVGDWYHVIVESKTGYMLAKYITPLGGNENSPGSYAIVKNPNPSDRLHLRVSANTGAASLGKYYNGVKVELLSYSSDTWAKVRIGNLVGYMLKQYLTTGNVVSAIPTMVVNNPNASDRLNLRETQSDKGNSLGKYYNGTYVEVLGIGDTWYHVRVDGKLGFMMAKYLK